MMEKKVNKSKASPKSKNPYKRRSDEEMSRIVNEIQQGLIGKRTACIKYGLNRNTLNLFISRQSTRALSDNHSLGLYTIMNDSQQNKALLLKIKELNAALDESQLKVTSLETMIQVAEKQLKIRIRKKSGTKQSKE